MTNLQLLVLDIHVGNITVAGDLTDNQLQHNWIRTKVERFRFGVCC